MPLTSALLTEFDLHLFAEGTSLELYEKLGAHPVVADGVSGTQFAVWAPNAQSVSVLGDFNYWSAESHPLKAHGGSGIWEAFLPGVEPGALYKYAIESRVGGYRTERADPFGFD
jgi:1,4-alpha-glucan branching enzyme